MTTKACLGPAAKHKLLTHAHGIQEVVAGVTKQYVTQVRDQLQAMRTAELSLQKVRKGRAAEASADGAKPLSAVDKVNAQLHLDAQVRFRDMLQTDGPLIYTELSAHPGTPLSKLLNSSQGCSHCPCVQSKEQALS